MQALSSETEELVNSQGRLYCIELIPNPFTFTDNNKEAIWEKCSMPESEMHTKFWSENLKRRTAWKTLRAHRRIILKCILKKQGISIKTGLTGLEQEPRNRVMTLRG